jgi:hypothetical protein
MAGPTGDGTDRRRGRATLASTLLPRDDERSVAATPTDPFPVFRSLEIEAERLGGIAAVERIRRLCEPALRELRARRQR